MVVEITILAKGTEDPIIAAPSPRIPIPQTAKWKGPVLPNHKILNC